MKRLLGFHRDKTMSIIYCQCGCGITMEPTDKYGRPHKYVFGHQSKGRIYKKEKYDSRRSKNHYFWKGGKIMSSDGYYLIYKPNHPNCDRDGYIREHRLVYEQYNKCLLLKSTVIHHINGVKTDNRIENLEAVINNGVHNSLHHEHKRDPNTGRFI